MTNRKDVPTTTYNLAYGWKIEWSDRVDLLENTNGKVAIILKSKNFGDVSPIVLDVAENAVRVHSLPHFIDHLLVTLDKKIELVYSSFILEQEEN